jgi:hypothetical protein
MRGVRRSDQTSISVSMPISMLDAVRKHCGALDITVSQYLRQRIRDDLLRHGYSLGMVPSVAKENAAGAGSAAGIRPCPRKLKTMVS